MRKKPGDRSGERLFRRTQIRLTLQYSAVLIVFFALFIATVYGLLYFLLVREQRADLADWMDRLTQSHADSRPQTGGGRVDLDFGGAKNMSVWWSDGSGTVRPVDGGETNETLQSGLLKLGAAEGGSRRYSVLEFEGADANGQSESRFLVASEQAIGPGGVAGTLYAARDVTTAFGLFDRLLAVLSLAALLFCVLAVYLSWRMSGRAMIPIRRSYERQLEFTADASHELRTPLSVLLSSIDVLELEDDLAPDGYGRRVLADMREEVKRMSRLSGSLLELARADSGNTRPDRTEFEVGAAVDRAVASLAPLAQAKGIELSVADVSAGSFRADREQLTRLMVILLDNAVKYTPEGGRVELEARIERGKKDLLRIRVRDNGIGIPESELGRIFERFYRVDKVRGRDTGGHGLGLAIGKWIAESHGGRLTASSPPAGGSLFEAEIPSE